MHTCTHGPADARAFCRHRPQVNQYPFSDNQPVQLPDWMLFTMALADDVFAEQSPKQLLKIRGKLYELLSSCIPPDTVMRTLVSIVLKKLPKQGVVKDEVCLCISCARACLPRAHTHLAWTCAHGHGAHGHAPLACT